MKWVHAQPLRRKDGEVEQVRKIPVSAEKAYLMEWLGLTDEQASKLLGIIKSEPYLRLSDADWLILVETALKLGSREPELFKNPDELARRADEHIKRFGPLL